MEIVKKISADPYEIVKVKENEFVIKVLVYGHQNWYPWSYKFITERGYPSKDLEKAKIFLKAEDASNWIEEHFMNKVL